MNLTESSARVALAAFLHDLGKLSERAGVDRVASGFERDKFDSEYNNRKERENHYCARLLTLFEQIGRTRIEEGGLAWRYPLKPLAPENLFPQPAQVCTPRDNAAAKTEYHALWDIFSGEIA